MDEDHQILKEQYHKLEIDQELNQNFVVQYSKSEFENIKQLNDQKSKDYEDLLIKVKNYSQIESKNINLENQLMMINQEVQRLQKQNQKSNQWEQKCKEQEVLIEQLSKEIEKYQIKVLVGVSESKSEMMRNNNEIENYLSYHSIESQTVQSPSLQNINNQRQSTLSFANLQFNKK